MKKKQASILAVSALAASAALTAGSALAQANDTLAKVKASGAITEGVRESSGLAYTLGNGQYTGFHFDVCANIIKDLEKSLGRKLEVKYQPVTSQNRIPLVQNGTVDLECGSTTNNAARQKDVAFGVTTYIEETKILVKANSSIHALADLKGKTFAFGAPSSTSGSLMPRYFLLQAGINPEKDFKTVAFSGAHDATVAFVAASRAEAGVLSVMAAFNDVDGVPMHAHQHLLRDVLKDEWGFDGVVVADWNGIGQIVFAGVAEDDREAARLAIEAGVDLDMVSGAYLAHLGDLVRDGEVDEALVDDACRRVLRMKFRLGLFDGAAGPDSRPVGNAPTPDTRALARRAGVASHVLVKNDGTLPLADDASVLLTGGFVHEGDVLLGTWVLDGRAEEVVTPAAGLTERLGDRVSVDDGRFPDRTLQLARTSDVTVALVGEHPNRSGEANSVSDLRLPPGQLDQLRMLAGLRKPLVVVVYTGRPLDLTEVLDLADTVIVAWHPGIEAGSALADVLSGDASPYGRLPMTFPLSTGHIPTSTHQRPTGRLIRADVDHEEGRYVDALTYPRLPFGHGLTYSTVDYGPPRVSEGELGLESATTLTVTVTNTGDRACREVVQAYFRDPVAQVTRPLVELLDWRLVDLEPGQSEDVTFEVSATAFSYFGIALTERVDEGEVLLLTGPDAATLQQVSLRVTAAEVRP